MSQRYSLEPKNRFLLASRAIVNFEIKADHKVTFVSEVDLRSIETMRKHASAESKPSYTAFVVKAVALALKEYPYANRRLAKRIWWPLATPRLQRFNHCDVAVAAERSLENVDYIAFADIFRDADQAPLAEISVWLRKLALADTSNNKQWREFSTIIQKLPTFLSTFLIRLPFFVPKFWDKYRGASVLISSPAKYGVDAVITNWAWPIGVSFGLVRERAIVSNGKVIAAPTFHLTLNFDRRIMAGAQGARFFNRMVEILENAEREIGQALPITSVRNIS